MINFPDAPTNGQTFSAAGCLYTFQSSPTPLWLPSTSSLGTTIISDTAPATPAVGQHWFDSVGAQEYIWMNDGTSTQWIPVTNQPGPQTGYQAGTGLALNTGTTPTTIALTTPVSVANGGTGAAVSKAAVGPIGLGNPATVAAGTTVMAGFGAQATPLVLTPVVTGTVLAAVTIICSNSVAGGIALVYLRYGTGAAPGNGAAATGTQIGYGAYATAVANNGATISLTAVVHGLTIGTAYWFDCALQSGGTSSTMAPGNPFGSLVEI